MLILTSHPLDNLYMQIYIENGIFLKNSLMCTIQIVGGNWCDALGKKSSLPQTIWVVLVIPKVFAIIVFFFMHEKIVSRNEDKSERSEQNNSNMVLNDSNIWNDHTIMTWNYEGIDVIYVHLMVYMFWIS
jgi:hypothetical protein